MEEEIRQAGNTSSESFTSRKYDIQKLIGGFIFVLTFLSTLLVVSRTLIKGKALRTNAAFPVTTSVSPTPKDKQIRKLVDETFSLDGCEMDEIRSHKTVCCADIDLPAFGGIDIVELTKDLLDDHGENLEEDLIEDGETFENNNSAQEIGDEEPEEHTNNSDTSSIDETEKTKLNSKEERVPVLGSTDYPMFLPTSVGMFKLFFVSEENRQTFLQNPWKYVPAYGGFAAEGFIDKKANDKKYALKLGPYTDLSNWDIIDGRLFFFGSLKGKGKFLMADDAVSVADAAWSLYYDGNLQDGYLNTNCFTRTSFDDILNGEVITEESLYQQQASEGNGGSGGSGGNENKDKGNSDAETVIYAPPPTLLEKAQSRWELETTEQILDFTAENAREFNLIYLET